jgi:hypothetical protein
MISDGGGGSGGQVQVPDLPGQPVVPGSYGGRLFYADSKCSPSKLIHADAMVAGQCFPSYDPSKGASVQLLISMDPNYAQNKQLYYVTVFYSDAGCSMPAYIDPGTSSAATGGYSAVTADQCVHFTSAPYPSAPSSGYFKMGFLGHTPTLKDVSPATGVLTG